MCTVSMIGDIYSRKFQDQYPQIYNPGLSQAIVTRQEFDQLKKEVQDLRLLLQAAKEYDRKNGEPNCQMEEKVRVLKKVAELVGVELNL